MGEADAVKVFGKNTTRLISRQYAVAVYSNTSVKNSIDKL